MGSAESVHFLLLPRPDPNADVALNARVAQEMEALQIVVELGRKAREAKDLSLKKPVVDMVVVVSTEVQRAGLTKLQKYICRCVSGRRESIAHFYALCIVSWHTRTHTHTHTKIKNQIPLTVHATNETPIETLVFSAS